MPSQSNQKPRRSFKPRPKRLSASQEKSRRQEKTSNEEEKEANLPSPTKKLLTHEEERQMLIVAIKSPQKHLMKTKEGDETWYQPYQKEALKMLSGGKRKTNKDLATAIQNIYNNKHVRWDGNKTLYSREYIQTMKNPPTPSRDITTPERIR